MPSGSISRPKLRQATFVLPRTGQRLKGLVSLRNPRQRPDSTTDHDERRGLLSGQINHQSVISSWSRGVWTQAHQFLTSEPGIGVVKCSLAYFLGSLATFIPPISAFLGHQDGKHMVATVTVYFHPARSQGSMYKALVCALLAFCYSAFLSITSMVVEVFFQDSLHLPALGHGLVLIVFCGGGLGLVGWTKQRLGDPLVNVACSLASLSTITVLTKEDAVQSGDLSFAKISQVLKMVLMGVIVAMTVSFVVFPISARKKLRANLTTVTDTLAVMLGTITEGFLSGSEVEMKSTEFRDADTNHRKAYGQLDKLVREAKLEHYVAGTEKEYRLEKKLVRWVQDITHNMGGLRSAAELQFSLIKETIAREYGLDDQQTSSSIRLFSPLERSWSFAEGSFLEPIEERPEEDLSPNGSLRNSPIPATLLPAEVFTIFIGHLGPSMRSLAFTLKEIFNEIPFGLAPDYKVSVDSRLQTSLSRALHLYRESREKTLTVLYQQKEVMNLQSHDAAADLEEVSASCAHFSFSLLEFGEQLHDLLLILDELQLEVEERPNGRSWNWLKFWTWSKRKETDAIGNFPMDSSSAGLGIDEIRPTVNRTIHRDPSVIAYAKRRLGYRVWKSLELFRRDDTKYAIKVGTGAALYALPSFLPSTRPFYQHWRGEWGLLSYMLVCSMTIGASNTTGYARFLGTILGAFCAVVAWYLTAGNVFGLAFLGWLMALWPAYLTIVKGNGPMGRFIMLTYNLSVLGAHPVITEIVLHRVVAVLSGCIWGIIITRVIWPLSARTKLKGNLSLLWLHLSLIWKRDPLSSMVQGSTTVGYMSPREKLEIERFLAKLESLQASARSEFELRSVFPDAEYGNIIRRTRSMVNAFLAMNLELVKNVTATEGEINLLRYTAAERQQLSARISHLLSVMASSMKLEYPLNEVLPSIDHARDRLLARIYRYRQDQEVSQKTTDEDCALLYAYILVTGQLSSEIMAIIGVIGQLFGVLNEDVVALA
ncbi:hypothetical protein N7474_007100 [Penicillium riverlandense]|uniref:uncharacterized protein n=1 Tax=Penicillium riverlandense TaxID=1903569 RepID=UPI0025470EC0|nr:uncharacterized protein N7474_007100 [Penicillium riverlandense]KAJ5815323.1 hypothetical protein N7474_007100 [Penicillium riverlandense]